jgi:hypothetical protein
MPKSKQAATSANSTLILERSVANGLPATYILGSYATRVTFHAQQIRAFNLVWALLDQNIIQKGSKICVIGGGLSGITAAAAASLKECNVTLYESKQQLMQMQRGNSTRYIHPNIYDWPLQGSEFAKTKLPCLNWKAAKTEDVIEQIEQEWELVKGGINFQPNRKVNHISDDGGKPRIGINSPFTSEKFDCVIIATGFGSERSFANVQVRQYWDVENLHQPVNWPVLPKSFLVSGCGDGGLIDVLRLKLLDFKHEKFTAEFLQNESLKELRDKLVEIEDTAPADPKQAVYHFIDNYKLLPVSENLKDSIKQKIRTDTKVSLNSSLPTPLSGVSSILNRFAIYLLSELGELTYIPGKITSVVSTGTAFNVVFSDNGRILTEMFDDVIVRHGPEPVIQDLVPGTHIPVRANKKDVTAQKLWPNEFYPAKTLTAKKESKMDRAYRYINDFRDFLSDKVTLNLLGVSGTKSSPLYSVIIEEAVLPETLKDLKHTKALV